MAIANNVKSLLAENRPILGAGIRFARTVDVAKAMKVAGYDWLFIDLEHSSIPLDIAAQISAAALDAGIAPFVRVPQGEIALATRALDSGALGIVIPHVETADEARDLVQALRLPPTGRRSFSGLNAQREYRTGNRVEASAFVEDNMMLVVMLESPEAIDQADAIAAVPGIDVVMIGTNDLCTEMGIAGQYTHPQVLEAYRTLVVACERHGKLAGTGGVDGAEIRPFIELGARFVLSGTDMGFLMSGARARSEFLLSLKVQGA